MQLRLLHLRVLFKAAILACGKIRADYHTGIFSLAARPPGSVFTTTAVSLYESQSTAYCGIHHLAARQERWLCKRRHAFCRVEISDQKEQREFRTCSVRMYEYEYHCTGLQRTCYQRRPYFYVVQPVHLPEKVSLPFKLEFPVP